MFWGQENLKQQSFESIASKWGNEGSQKFAIFQQWNLPEATASIYTSSVFTFSCRGTLHWDNKAYGTAPGSNSIA